jgi:hypothetical protein
MTTPCLARRSTPSTLVTLIITLGLVVLLIPSQVKTVAGASPELSLSPTHGQPGETVHLSGSRFPHDAPGQVVLTEDDSTQGTFDTDDDGRFAIDLVIPALVPGPYTYEVAVDGGEPGQRKSESIDFTVDVTPPTATPTETSTPTETPTNAPTDTPASTDTPAPTETKTAVSIDTAADEPFFFSDGFESGDLSAWTRNTGLTIQQDEVLTGAYAARGTTTSGTTWASLTLPSVQPELYFRVRFKLVSEAPNGVYLQRMRVGSGAIGSSLVGVMVRSSGKLAYRNDVSDGTTTTTTTVTVGTWHEVQVHLVVNGANGLVELWYDGSLVSSKSENLGTTGIGRVQVGDNASGKTYDVAFDDVDVSTSFVQGAFVPPPTDTATPESATAVPTSTATPEPPTSTPTVAPTDSPAAPTATAKATATRTPAATGTSSPTPAHTPTPTATRLPPTSTVPATNTPNPTATPTRVANPTATPANTSTPLPTRTPIVTPTKTPTPTSGSSATILAAGDIASCSSSGDEATAALVKSLSGDVITLGDNAYESGSSSEYANCYDPTWGQFKNRTHPAPGNHEYNTSGATGYYGYFGAAAGDPSSGYYSFDMGSWHVIVLNSNCSAIGGCSVGSPQEKWLRSDLAANPTACTMAVWHHPLYSSGEHGNDPSVKPLYQALYDGNAEIVLVGHDHDYERFGPQDANGNADPNRGIREFVVGTGGKGHYAVQTIRPNSEVRNNDTFGVLKLVLSPTSYSWEFLPIAGKTFTDSGTSKCHDGSGPLAQAAGPAGAPDAAIAGADTVAGVADRPRGFGRE